MRTNWIARRVHSRRASRPVLSTCWAGRRRCRRCQVPSSVARAPCLSCCRRLALLCLLRASRAGFPPVSPSCLLAIRSARFALSSYRSAPRSFDKWGGANVACVSVFVRLGRCCLLLAVAGRGCGGCGSPRGVAHIRRVDGVGLRHDFRRPVACFALVVIVCRHGLIVIGCCRRGSASSSCVSVVVVISVSPVGRPPLIISLIVSLIVSPFVLSSRLACREAVRLGVAGSLSSRAARCLGCRSLGSVRLPWWRLVLSVCLLTASVFCGGGALAWRVVAALPPSPVARAACLCVVGLSVGSASLAVSLAVRLIVRLVAPHVLAWRCAAVVGVSCLRLAFPRYEYRPVPLVVGAGRYFFPCRLFRFAANQRGMRAYNRS